MTYHPRLSTIRPLWPYTNLQELYQDTFPTRPITYHPSMSPVCHPSPYSNQQELYPDPFPNLQPYTASNKTYNISSQLVHYKPSMAIHQFGGTLPRYIPYKTYNISSQLVHYKPSSSIHQSAAILPRSIPNFAATLRPATKPITYHPSLSTISPLWPYTNLEELYQDTFPTRPITYHPRLTTVSPPHPYTISSYSTQIHSQHSSHMRPATRPITYHPSLSTASPLWPYSNQQEIYQDPFPTLQGPALTDL